MIQDTIERWHRHLRGDLPGGLDELLADDVVFYSPIVYTPQQGKEITKRYLAAAGATLGGSDGGASGSAQDAPFRYTKQVIADDTAVLEFETNVHGTYVNGVDIVRVDDRGMIVEFRVMLRPLQAVNLVHEQMRAALESSQASAPDRAVRAQSV